MLQGGSSPTPARFQSTRLPFTPVFAKDTAGVTLDSDVTDRNGDFELRFSLPAGQEYFVEALAQVTDPGNGNVLAPVQGRRTGSLATYKAQTGFIPSTGNQTVVNELEVNLGNDSGAFYIASKMSEGIEWVRAKVRRSVPVFGVFWERGQIPGTRYDPTTDTVFLDHGDEFDDSVIMHELMHHVLCLGPDGPRERGSRRDQLRRDWRHRFPVLPPPQHQIVPGASSGAGRFSGWISL